ncbi:unnamed protein product [Brassica oleracea var. botrytis]
MNLSINVSLIVILISCRQYFEVGSMLLSECIGPVPTLPFEQLMYD